MDNTLNQTPLANRYHIAFFGRTNSGKSSLINAITSQQVSTVSPISGTTTDAVYKTMEILPLGPVVLIDTAGFLDDSTLGKIREKNTERIIKKSNLAIVVVDASTKDISFEIDFVNKIKQKLNVVVAVNKIDLTNIDKDFYNDAFKGTKVKFVSSTTKDGIDDLKETIGHVKPKENDIPIIADLINEGDIVVLVTPIDSSAPKGRMILPQQQTIRDVLDAGAINIVCKEFELEQTLKHLNTKPALVVTDSQAFEYVSKRVPDDIFLTSFSILFARHKGNLKQLVMGAKALKNLEDGDKILVSEGCTHHRQCEDIGSVKIPNWLQNYTNKKFTFEFSSGITFTDDPSTYKLIIHCGGCMLGKKAMASRLEDAKNAGIPIVNYGVLIAYLHGILDRALKIFKDIDLMWRQQ